MSPSIPVGPPVRTATGARAAASDVDQRHPGHLDGVLHAEEQTGPGPLPGGQGQEVDTVEGHRPLEDLVAGPAHQHMGQRALARPVGAHDGVDLAAAHGQGHPLQDLAARDAGPEPFDAQLAGAHGTTTDTSSPSTTSS